ncbi:MAG: phospholipase [Planctomycetota bacterium]|nr:phospholipase [Planctomycetota bacterium]
MATTSVTNTLRTLHRHHQQLSDLHGRLEAGPRQVKACKLQLATAEASLAEILQRAKGLRMQADEKQLQLRSAEQKIVDLEGKRNACKTNREYQTLEEQIAADQMASRVLEDEILELLERADAAKAEAPAAEQLVSAARERLSGKEAVVSQEKSEIEGELTRVGASLAEAEGELAADVRSTYDRVVRGKGADGLAAVEGESCGGCFQKITGNMLSELILGRLVACRSCGRLLYSGDTRSPAEDA